MSARMPFETVNLSTDVIPAGGNDVREVLVLSVVAKYQTAILIFQRSRSMAAAGCSKLCKRL
ncbi:hypothetical protein BG910_03745 [Neisseria chenwenguii]|uniref:Uncharacterized protein n=1 Tax=Neisseria chenwenguii TaxID=1853278 RepID=A0A220S0G8_9NEIS|nr:hypothetical protein BG910_03745 [Neisseria chenwenguii]ROV56129.1 hypothetical protein EGS38_06625 [Neisseria chenwenguii]